MTLTTALIITTLFMGVLVLAFFIFLCVGRGAIQHAYGDGPGSNAYISAGALCIIGVCVLSFMLGRML